jgi:hypothetical protein
VVSESVLGETPAVSALGGSLPQRSGQRSAKLAEFESLTGTQLPLIEALPVLSVDEVAANRARFDEAAGVLVELSLDSFDGVSELFASVQRAGCSVVDVLKPRHHNESVVVLVMPAHGEALCCEELLWRTVSRLLRARSASPTALLTAQRASQAEKEIRALRARLLMVETSTSFKIGSAVVQAAVNPRKHALSFLRLVVSALKARKTRALKGSYDAEHAKLASASSDSPQHGLPDGMMWLGGADIALSSESDLTIAGIFSKSLFQALSSKYRVVGLGINSYRFAIGQLLPDVVIFDSEAFAPHEGWSYGLSGAAPGHDTQLEEILDWAASVGAQTVFWHRRPVSEDAFYRGFAARCTALVSPTGLDLTELRTLRVDEQVLATAPLEAMQQLETLLHETKGLPA